MCNGNCGCGGNCGDNCQCKKPEGKDEKIIKKTNEISKKPDHFRHCSFNNCKPLNWGRRKDE